MKAASDGASCRATTSNDTDARAASGNSSWIRLSIAFFTWYQQTKRIMSLPNTSEAAAGMAGAKSVTEYLKLREGQESIRFFLWFSRQSGMDLLEGERGLLLSVVLGHGVERELVVLYRLAGADGQASQHKETTRVRRAHHDNGEPLPY